MMRRVQRNALLLLAALVMIATCAAAASTHSTPAVSISPRSLRRLLQAPSRAPHIPSPTEVAALDDSEEEENAASSAIQDDGEAEKPSPSDLMKGKKGNNAAAQVPTTAAAGKPVSGPASPAGSLPAVPASNSNAANAVPAEEEEDDDDQFPMMVGGGLGLQHSETIKIGEHNHEGDLSDPLDASAAGHEAAAGAPGNEPVPDVPPTAGSVPAVPTAGKGQVAKLIPRQPAAGATKPSGLQTPRSPLKSEDAESQQDPAGGASAHESETAAVDFSAPGHATATKLAEEKARLDAQHKKEQQEEDAALGAVPHPPLPTMPVNEPEEEEEPLPSKPVTPVQPVKPVQGGSAPAAGTKAPVVPKPTAGSIPSGPAADVSAEEDDQTATLLDEPTSQRDAEPAPAPVVQLKPRPSPNAEKKRGGAGSGAAAVDRSPVSQTRVVPEEESSPLSGPSAPKSANDTKPATSGSSSVIKKTLPKNPPTPAQPPANPAPAAGAQSGVKDESEAPLTEQPAGESVPEPVDAKSAAAAAAAEAKQKATAALKAKEAAAKQAAEKAKAEAQELEPEPADPVAQTAEGAATPANNNGGTKPSGPSGPVPASKKEDPKEEKLSGPVPRPSGADPPKGNTDANSTAAATESTTKPVSSGPKPTKPKPPVPAKPTTQPVTPPPKASPQLQEEGEGDITQPSAAAQAAADGSGAVRTEETVNADPEATVVPKSAANTTSAAPLPSCMLRDARLSFVGGDLRLYVKIVQSASCAVSDDLELRASLSMFESGVANRCTHTMRLSSTEIKQASSGDDGYVILAADKTRSMVPEVRYNVEFASCPALAQSPQECKPVPRSKVSGSDTLMRPATAATLNGGQAVRIVTSTAEKYRAPFDPVLAGEDLSRSIIEALQSSPDVTASLRSLSAQRLLVSFVDHDDNDEQGTHVHFDVLPMPAGGAFTGETMEAPELAERVRCFLINKTKVQDTAQLKLIGPIVSIEQFDPCVSPADAAACAIVRPPTTTVEPTSSNPDEPFNVLSGPTPTPAAPVKPSGPTRAAPTIDDEQDPDQVDIRAPPKLPAEPAAPAKTINEEDDDLVGAASAEELDAARADVPAPAASTGYADQLSEMLGGLNPLYAMGLVGAILAVTFWALCLRGSSEGPRRTETAALDQPDEELGGVEMARGSSRHGGFAPLQNQDDDSSMSSATQPTPTLASVPTGTPFANEKEEGSASKFLISVLISIGIPSFGTAKYSQILKDNYLSRLDQLKQLDGGDWKRLGLPFVIEEALRKALLEHTNREGKFAAVAAGSGGNRAKGLDLKASGANKKATGSTTKDKHKKGGLSVSALSNSPKDDADADTDLGLDLEDPFASPAATTGAGAAEEEEDNDEPAVRDEAASSSAGKKKGSSSSSSSKPKKESKKSSLLLAPPSNDAVHAQDDSADDSAEKLGGDDDWMSKF